VSARAAAVRVSIVAACLLVAAWPSEPAGLDPQYLALLQRYAAGDRPQAIAALGEWSERAVRNQLAVVQDARAEAERCPGCPDPLADVPLRAAVMLHADRDQAERPKPSGREQLMRCPGFHARIAREYAATLARDVETRDFARRFFLATTLGWQLDACFEDALAQAHAGLELFPRDAELFLAAGSVLEERATLPIAGDKSDTAPVREDWLKNARSELASAISNDPDLALARLRLGRVLWQLGRSKEAGAALESAVARTLDPRDLYLAHLFLGRIHEDAHRLDQAIAQYRRAVDLDPGAQSAAVALSHALQLAGEMDAARRALARGLVAREAPRDPYWDYLVSDARPAEDMLATLHRESLQ
jgi:tetratricopeptide (TPR) repeat protein